MQGKTPRPDEQTDQSQNIVLDQDGTPLSEQVQGCTCYMFLPITNYHTCTYVPYNTLLCLE